MTFSKMCKLDRETLHTALLGWKLLWMGLWNTSVTPEASEIAQRASFCTDEQQALQRFLWAAHDGNFQGPQFQSGFSGSFILLDFFLHISIIIADL